jgi:hypothetical protein
VPGHKNHWVVKWFANIYQLENLHLCGTIAKPNQHRDANLSKSSLRAHLKLYALVAISPYQPLNEKMKM